jgi:hypothetical protein
MVTAGQRAQSESKTGQWPICLNNNMKKINNEFEVLCFAIINIAVVIYKFQSKPKRVN